MSTLLLYVAAALLLLACLLRLFLNEKNEEHTFSDTEEPHDLWCTGGSAMQVARYLFGSEDWKYVASLGSKTLKRHFLKERRALALAWVEAARSEARALMRVHRTTVRTSPHLHLGVELRISCVYFEFLLYCSLLHIAIRMRGPVALQSFVALADARSARLYESIGRVFPFTERSDGDFGHSPLGGGGHQ
jgi:hypothetical protein